MPYSVDRQECELMQAHHLKFTPHRGFAARGVA